MTAATKVDDTIPFKIGRIGRDYLIKTLVSGGHTTWGVCIPDRDLKTFWLRKSKLSFNDASSTLNDKFWSYHGHKGRAYHEWRETPTGGAYHYADARSFKKEFEVDDYPGGWIVAPEPLVRYMYNIASYKSTGSERKSDESYKNLLKLQRTFDKNARYISSTAVPDRDEMVYAVSFLNGQSYPIEKQQREAPGVPFKCRTARLVNFGW